MHKRVSVCEQEWRKREVAVQSTAAQMNQNKSDPLIFLLTPEGEVGMTGPQPEALRLWEAGEALSTYSLEMGI